MEFNQNNFTDLYVNEQKTLAEIAVIFCISFHQAKYWARKWSIPTRGSHRKRTDVLGQRFGMLTVKSLIGIDRKTPMYSCVCDCGAFVKRTSSSLTNSRHKTKCCWDCRRQILRNTKWKGYEDISGDWWSTIQRQAASRSIEFNLEISEIYHLLQKQNYKCALSQLEIYLVSNNKSRPTASLDRINSNGDYTIDNVQWVHKDVNKMKMDFNQSHFITMCKLIADAHR